MLFRGQVASIAALRFAKIEESEGILSRALPMLDTEPELVFSCCSGIEGVDVATVFFS